MKKITIILLSLMSIFNCYLNDDDSNSDMSDDIVNIQKCAIKYAINPSASPLNSYTSLYFIAIAKYNSSSEMLDEKYDPSTEILNELTSENYNVKKFSGGEYIFDDSHNGFYDKTTGEQGVLISIGDKVNSKIDYTTVTINVDIYLGNLFAEGYLYTLKYSDGSWKVTEVEMAWISKK